MSKLKDRKKAKRLAAKEVIKAGLKKAGKKLLSGALGVGSALLNTQKAYAPNNMGKYVKQKDGSVRFEKMKFKEDDGKGGPLPKRKNPKTSHYLPKKSTKKPKMQDTTSVKKRRKKINLDNLSTKIDSLESKIKNINVKKLDSVVKSKIGNIKNIFQGSKQRKKIRETRKKRKRTFNPYD